MYSVHFDWSLSYRMYLNAIASIFKIWYKNVASLKKTGVILHPYSVPVHNSHLYTMATFLCL